MITAVLLLIIYITFISLGLPDTLLGSAWPVMYKDLEVSISIQGAVSVIISATTVLSSFMSGAIMKRFKIGKIIFVSVFLTAAALLGFSFSHHIWILSLLAIPLGLGAGCIDSCLNSFVADNYSAMHMNWLHCFWGIGATAGPVILSGFLAKGNWRGGYRSVAVIQLIIVAVLLISMPLWEKVRKKSVTEEHEEKNDVTYLQTIKQKGAVYDMLAFFFYGGVEQLVGLWGASYITLHCGMGADIGAKMSSMYFMGIAIGRLISGLLTLRVTNKQLIYSGIAVILAGLGLLLAATGQSMFFCAFILVGLGVAPIFPSMVSETPSRFGNKFSQSIMGMQMASAYLGIATIPPLFGVMAKINIAMFPYCVMTANVLLLLMTIMISKKTRRK